MPEPSTDQGIIQATLELFLRTEREQEGRRPTACGTANRASSAWNCDRAVGFEAARVAECEELPYETHLAFTLGNSMHERVQSGLQSLWSTFQSEVKCDLRPLGYDVSGHADGLIIEGDRRVVLEIKTAGAYPFKLCRDGGKGQPAGPKRDWLLQAGIYALGLDAEGVRIVAISKDANNRDRIKPGMTLEFYIGMDEVVEPDGHTLRELVIEELDRMQSIWEQVKAGMIPARHVPEWGYVNMVPTYQGTSKELPWNCRYCRMNTDCRSLPTEAVPVEFASANVRNTWNPPVDGLDVGEDPTYNEQQDE